MQMTNRYARQMVLPEVGADGQARIQGARVLVVGAGGLGCAVLQYLCAAGVGRLTIVDHDRVDETNLHRQPLYRMSDLGRLKTEAARDALRALNPNVDIRIVCERLTPANAPALIAEADVVVDAADTFAVTYTLSDECTPLARLVNAPANGHSSRPLVSASVLGLSGYAGVFCGNAPSYRAVFPEMPAHAGSCASTGVLGTAVGVMGTIQAHLVLSVILDLSPSVAAQLITIDFRSFRVGGFNFASAQEPAERALRFIARDDVTPADITVDLRSIEEAVDPAFGSSLRVLPHEIERVATDAAASRRVVLCCRSGVRAWQAATRLRTRGLTNLALIALGD